MKRLLRREFNSAAEKRLLRRVDPPRTWGGGDAVGHDPALTSALRALLPHGRRHHRLLLCVELYLALGLPCPPGTT